MLNSEVRRACGNAATCGPKSEELISLPPNHLRIVLCTAPLSPPFRIALPDAEGSETRRIPRCFSPRSSPFRISNAPVPSMPSLRFRESDECGYSGNRKWCAGPFGQARKGLARG